MILYPTRTRLSKDDYQASCVGGEAWNLIDSISTGKRALIFLPGSLTFGTVGFLGIFPAAALLSFILLLVLSATPASAQGNFIFFGATVATIIHCALMLRVSLGFVYAQQDLVRYLQVILAISCGSIVYGILKGSTFGYLLLPIFATLLAAFLVRLSRSTNFSLYADLMRVKRVYLRQRSAQTKARREKAKQV